MATFAAPAPFIDRERRFFLVSAIVMTMVLVCGFTVQFAMGRSTFGAPLYIHLHALVFFGWAMLYLLQTAFIATGSLAFHKRVGWLAVVWVPAMIVTGTFVTVVAARTLRVPFFFQPGYFLVMDPMSVLGFAGLTAAAIVQRRRTLWHRRLMYSGMTILMGPGIGRLLPMPFLIPYAGWAVFAVIMLFPIAGMIHDRKSLGRVHPATLWGIGAIVAMQVAIDVITFSPLGPALYHLATAGSPGAAIDPLAFQPPPPM
jgi:hypothetical protein